MICIVILRLPITKEEKKNEKQKKKTKNKKKINK